MSLRLYLERRYEEMRSTGRFNPYGNPPMTEAKLQVIEDSRSLHYGLLKEAMAELSIPLDDQGLTSVAEIDDSLLRQNGRYQPPGGIQRRSDMEDLGWRKKKTSMGLNRWIAPEEYRLAWEEKVKPQF